MKNLTNSINNNEALKALEQSVEQQLAGYAVFPFAFYREDGSYIKCSDIAGLRDLKL